MSDQFSRTTRAYTGGADPHISINSVSEAAAHIVGAFAFPLLGPAGVKGGMSLRVVAGRLDLSSSSIVCQLDDGETRVVCTIARQALRDMGDYHQLSGSEEAVFSQMLPEIERLATEKFQAGFLDENGGLSIGTADLLRYLRPRPQ